MDDNELRIDTAIKSPEQLQDEIQRFEKRLMEISNPQDTAKKHLINCFKSALCIRHLQLKTMRKSAKSDSLSKNA